jgi:CheY-like chemotaxis protein
MSKLLVVDDDEHMLASLADILSQAGHQVISAASGLEALDRARGIALDLVVSDVRMAGMDGIECIERLTEQQPNLRSIIITGYAASDVPSKAMDLCTMDYLCKPFTEDQLIQSVERALNRPQAVDLADYPVEMRETMQSLADLEATRQRALQNFYLGIRSGHLSSAAALVCWDALEAVEVRHYELKQQLQLRLEMVELQDSYVEVSEFCKAPPALPAQRREGAISRVAFQPFYKNIREGKIASEQIPLAVKLRLEQRQEGGDSDLFRSLWN